ncbi:MAG: competence/damage-inducible protein A [Bacteroidota bacterium]
MKSQIITIGDELLIGQVLNTNAPFIAQKLNSIGIQVIRTLTVGDVDDEILKSFQESFAAFDLTIVTGGLGPTHDDITRKNVCAFFNTDLVRDEATVENIKRLFTVRNIQMNALTEDQAMVPRKAKIIPNLNGTAPGYLFDHENKYLIVLPGVPYEMEAMMVNFVIPFFQKLSHQIILHRTLKTTGIPESLLARRLGDIDELMLGAKLAFLPAPSGVRLRITVIDADPEAAEQKVKEVEARIRSKVEKFIYGTDTEELEEVLGKILTDQRLTIAVAESCTGGNLANRLTNVAGSSYYFERGVITYSNQSKTDLLKIHPDIVEAYGAVSREVAMAMASGIRDIARVDIGLSVTGIAGPSGGTPDKPVGTVWIGYSDEHESFAVKFNFGENRLRVKERASQAALDLLRRKLLQLE